MNLSHDYLFKLAEDIVGSVNTQSDSNPMWESCLKGFHAGFVHGQRDTMQLCAIHIDNVKRYAKLQHSENEKLKLEKRALELRLAELLAKFN